MSTSASETHQASKEGAGSRQLLFFCAFLLATLATGLLLRWEMAGVTASWIQRLDLRRAHSHLGFYGVLFPATWVFLCSITPGERQTWVPSGKLMIGYGTLVALSAVGFLWQGYGPLAIATSTGVLAIWLVFAWKIRPGLRFFQHDWLASASLSIVASACMIPFVAINTHRDPVLADQLARTFLTLLLIGVFVPTALRHLGGRAPVAWTWFIATLAGAVYLTQLSTHWLPGLGLLWLAFGLAQAVFTAKAPSLVEIQGHRRLLLLWLGFAGALALTGAGLLPYSHFVAIAGIHYLILGPVLLTFALVRVGVRPHPILRIVYELSVLAMSTSIVLQEWDSARYMIWQQTAASAGSLIFASIAITIAMRARTKPDAC